MLSSSCSMRFLSLLSVKFLSRLLTALNLLPSMATIASLLSARRFVSAIRAKQARPLTGPSATVVIAVDGDPQALRAILVNAERNAVAVRCAFTDEFLPKPSLNAHSKSVPENE